jgi:hypothetical protein
MATDKFLGGEIVRRAFTGLFGNQKTRVAQMVAATLKIQTMISISLFIAVFVPTVVAIIALVCVMAENKKIIYQIPRPEQYVFFDISPLATICDRRDFPGAGNSMRLVVPYAKEKNEKASKKK